MTRVGLSVSSKDELIRAVAFLKHTEISFREPPVAENVAKTATNALRAAAVLLDFVDTYNIPADQFLPLALQCERSEDLYEKILDYVKSHQKE